MSLLRLPSRTARLMACAAAAAMLTAAAPALAQTGAAPGPQVDSVRLLELLVENGNITREQADSLLVRATVPAPAAAQTAALPPPAPGSQRIQYIPEVVRQQIKDELRAEVTQQARAEGWAQPGQIPEWLNGVEIFGDVRVRAEGVFQDGENGFAFPDFAAINGGSGFDITPNGPNAPLLNTSEDRFRARVRARLGLRAKVADGVVAEVRLATGNDSSPVSTNQTLGSGGYFSKYDLSVDRANIQLTMDGSTVSLGRFANPFWTTPLLFDDDLNFDGVAVSWTTDPAADEVVFANFGAFPVFNTDFSFGSTRDAASFESRDQYLLGMQIGAGFKSSGVRIKGGLGYFHFVDAEGERSSPCFAPTEDTVCDTDSSRAVNSQFGNTLFAIRDILVDPNDPNGPQLQYFGRASEFEILNGHFQADFGMLAPYAITLEGDVVYNLGYDEDAIVARGPVNNTGPAPLNAFDGGALGWTINASLGAPRLERFADWRISLGYKYVESDAVVDALADSDFHLGGTNAQGFILGGEFGLRRNTWLAARWLSANEIAGPPYANDVVQLDLNAKF